MKCFARGMARVSAAALVVSALAVGGPGSAHATGTYLQLGNIKGEESPDKGHKEKMIEILSWSWGASPTGGMGTHAGGGGGGAGKVSMAKAHEPDSRRGKVAPAPGEAEITLKRGAPAEAQRPASTQLAPASRGAGSLTTLVPAGMCRAGVRYETVELGTGEQVYRMEDVLVTACAPGAASQDNRPMESISFNYSKIEY